MINKIIRIKKIIVQTIFLAQKEKRNKAKAEKLREHKKGLMQVFLTGEEASEL
jgi:hypothetical protein